MLPTRRRAREGALAVILIGLPVVVAPSGAHADGAQAGGYPGYVVHAPVRSAPAHAGRVVINGAGCKPATVAVPLEDFAAEDIEEAARQLGRSSQEVRQERLSLPAFEELTATLNDAKPGRVVASGLRHENGAITFWVQMIAAPSEEEVAVIERAQLDAVEVIYGVPANESDLEAASEAWSGVASRERDVLAYTASWYDPDSQKLILEYAPAPEALADDVRAVLDKAFAAAAASQSDGKLPVQIDLKRVEPQQVRLETTVQGGRNLTHLNGDQTCTTGFTAQRTSTGNYGVVTAAHCGSGLYYNGEVGVINAGPSVSPSDPKYDAQFHRTLTGNGHATNRQFRATATEDRKVSAASNPPVGASVCHWGMVSGYSCGTVFSLNGCYSDICGLDVVTGATSDYGDSGGPWFSGTVARGIHTGSVILTGLPMGTVFGQLVTRIGRVENTLGVEIYHT